MSRKTCNHVHHLLVDSSADTPLFHCVNMRSKTSVQGMAESQVLCLDYWASNSPTKVHGHDLNIAI